ncbi:hypothetical protein Tco_0741403, partial [Tanacetum coccineum]
ALLMLLEDRKATLCEFVVELDVPLTSDSQAFRLLKRSSKLNVSISGSGYHQKDRKPSQNDKTEHGMEKTVQNQGQSPKMPKSESILKNTVGCNLNPSDDPGISLPESFYY